MKQLLTIGLFLFFNNMPAQNLLQNPDFEEYYGCPTFLSQLDSCKNWFTILQNPDYYNCGFLAIDGIKPFDTLAYSGSGYVGFGGAPQALTCETFAQHLIISLKPALTYSLNFYYENPKPSQLSAPGNCGRIELFGFKEAPPTFTIWDTIHDLWQLPEARFLASSPTIYDSIWHPFTINFTVPDTINYFAITINDSITCYTGFFLDKMELVVTGQIGIKETEANSMFKILYDNGKLHLNTTSLTTQPFQCGIYNTSAQLLKQQYFESGKNSFELSCNNIANGMYYLVIKNNETYLQSIRFVVNEK